MIRLHCFLKKSTKRTQKKQVVELVYTAAMDDHGVVSKLLKGHRPKNRPKIDSSSFQPEQISKDYPPSRSEKDFDNYVEMDRFRQKQLLAEGFCRHGYGYDFLVDAINSRKVKIYMPSSKYAVWMASIISQTFRQIQTFLVEDCKRHIKRLSSLQLKKKCNIMLYCKTNNQLSSAQASIFMKFMKATFELENVRISQKEAVELYSALYRAFKINSSASESKGTKKTSRTYKKRRTKMKRNHYEKYWDKDMIDNLLFVYKKNHQIARIKSYFQQAYPSKTQLFNISNLKAKLMKIFRAAILKAKAFSFEKASKLFPKIAFLENLTIKAMLTSPFFQKTRYTLCDIFQVETLTLESVGDKLKQINEALVKYFEDGELDVEVDFQSISREVFGDEMTEQTDIYELNRRYLRQDHFQEKGFYYEPSDCEVDEDCQNNSRESLIGELVDTI